MTDNEIFETEIKCINRRANGKCNGGTDCCKCDLLMNEKDIISAYERAIANSNLINRQQTVYADLSKIIKKQKEEIVRLEYENEILSKNADTAFQDGLNEAQDLYAEQVKDEIKSEAIKELIDKLEPDHTFEIQRDDGYWEKVVRLESIKAIAKELVGED